MRTQRSLLSEAEPGQLRNSRQVHHFFNHKVCWGSGCIRSECVSQWEECLRGRVRHGFLENAVVL